MFYQEALLKFRFLSRVDTLLTIGDRHWRKVAAMFKKAESANSLPLAWHFRNPFQIVRCQRSLLSVSRQFSGLTLLRSVGEKLMSQQHQNKQLVLHHARKNTVFLLYLMAIIAFCDIYSACLAFALITWFDSA